VDILRPWSHLVAKFRNVTDTTDEITVGDGVLQRRYEVRLSALRDRQDQLIGRVVMLRLMDDAFVSQSGSAARETASRSSSKQFTQPNRPQQKRFLGWLIDFFVTPVRADLPIPSDINPGWYQARERSFTIIIRLSALVGTLAYILTSPFMRATTLTNVNIAYGAIIGLLWFLGLSRKVNFRYRAAMFLFLVYILGFVETLNFGYSSESFIFFMTLIVTSVLLTGRAGGWTAGLVSVVTLAVIGFLIGKADFVPFNLTVDALAPRTFQMGMTSLFVFSASAMALSTSIVILMESLNKAWQMESQASTLLQQERDLLERRVGERTQDLADARDSALRSNTELRQYFRIIEQSGNSIVITDLNGNIQYANPKFEQVSGYALEEVLGKNPRILKSGRQKPEFYEKMWGTISSGHIWDGVFHNKRKDGTYYWESATIAPVLDQDNQVVNYVAIKEDITSRREVESQLRKLSRAVEQSGNTIIIMDRNGVIEYVNPKFTEVTGYAPEEAIGKSPAALMQVVETPTDFTQDEWWLTVNEGHIWQGEFRNHRKDGSVFWESASIAPVQSRDGEITNFIEIKQDVTEQKVLQEQLQKQNDYLSILHQVTLDLLDRRNLGDLLKTIVNHSAALLDAPFSELMLLEGDDLLVRAATDNHLEILGERVNRQQAILSWKAFDTLQPVLLDDYSAWPGRRETYNEFSLHAVADFPVIAGDRCLGILALGRDQAEYPFTPEQTQTGILFARLVALVLDNVNLYDSAVQEIAERERAQTSLQRSHQQQQVINSLLKISLEDRSMDEVLDAILNEILSIDWLTISPKGGIFLFNDQTNLLDLRVHRNLSPHLQVLCSKVALGQCLCGRAALSREIQFSDCLDDRHEIRYDGIEEHGHYNIPIVQGESTLGVIVLYLPHGYQKVDDDLVFLRSAADAIAGLLRRKQAEILLLESEVRFRQIVENASDIIYRADMNGDFTYANPSALKLMGFTNERDVVGKNYLDLTTPEFRNKLKRVYDHQYLSKTQSTYYEFPAVTMDGEVVWVGQNVQLIMDGDQVIGFQAVARNITQLKQAQEALALSRDQALEASRFKSQLVSRVSHELRTPLGGILGYTELLQYEAFGPLNPAQQTALHNIVESTHFLTNTVNDLLDQAQIESKSLSLHNIYFNPLTLLEKIDTTMSVLAGKKGLAFHTEISTDLPGELYADEKRLQQVIINLAGNAIKFTNEGEVSVRISAPVPAFWTVEVRDTGVGIPLDERENIFEPFRQVSNAITRENRGSGLGLAIVKQLVELMGGQISLQSELGRGSVFTITLPLINAPGE
jgi:PAS domain S-box-containing protein